MCKVWIVGKTLIELEQIVGNLGFDSHLARELAIWIYKRRCTSIANMHTLPKALRNALEDRFTANHLQSFNTQCSTDGTKKYLFKTSKENPFEAAFMPGRKRSTLCISTQSGCKMGCSFCFTAKLGFNENLLAGHIVSQILSISEFDSINRIVLMGMGEPLDNLEEVTKALQIISANWGLAFGASKVTLSTVGLMAGLPQLVGLGLCNVAISLHSPFHEQRKKIAPAEKENSIQEIVEFFKVNPLKKGLRLSFEYVVIPYVNDTQIHAIETANLLSNLSCHINVIALNAENAKEQNQQAAKVFQKLLNENGQSATFRLSRGNDIDAACGMMAGKN